MKKSHSIVCRKFYEKKVILQYVENFHENKVIVQYVENVREKMSQYSMSKIFMKKGIVQYVD